MAHGNKRGDGRRPSGGGDQRSRSRETVRLQRQSQSTELGTDRSVTLRGAAPASRNADREAHGCGQRDLLPVGPADKTRMVCLGKSLAKGGATAVAAQKKAISATGAIARRGSFPRLHVNAAAAKTA